MKNEFEIRHIIGKSNIVADALSRSIVPDIENIKSKNLQATIYTTGIQIH